VTQKSSAKVERVSDRELVVTQTFNCTAQNIYRAWTESNIFKLWWNPEGSGMALLSCELDVRTGGGYKLTFKHPAAPESFSFYGKYIDVEENKRMVWTNEESEDGAVTTLTFEEVDGKTHLSYREVYATKEGFKANAGGTESGLPAQLAQLAQLLGDHTKQ
jgi:uncharacterized protein YndB with AHSA1/START domain